MTSGPRERSKRSLERARRAALAFLVAAALPACQRGAAPPAVTALIAASARDAVDEAGVLFAKKTGARVKVSPGASSALARQIIEGAPVDVYLAASPEWANAVKEQGLTLETRDLLANRLVIVAPRENPSRVKEPRDLASPAVKRVALAGENVPAGKYAAEALGAAGVYQELVDAKKIARGEDVRIALAYVERGEADAGIVYATDARIAPGVEVVHEFDPTLHAKIIYTLSLIRRQPANAAAKEFYDFLLSPAAAEVFRKHAFQVLAAEAGPAAAARKG